ncbi:MAG: hypothetical protein GX335_05015, partial [Firmicutes bacterium]|nr:hypothetical protein [Bacillota bacterium]
MKKILPRVGLVALLCLLLIVSAIPFLIYWSGVPRQLKVFPGMELSLELRPPLRLYDADGREVKGPFNTDQLGASTYQVSLFGWLNLSRVVVDVVPLIRVYPGGQSIGVLLSTEGLIVNQVGGVVGLDGKEHFPAKDGGILPGDVMLSVEGYKLRRPEQVSQLINLLAEQKNVLKIQVRRGTRTFICEVQPVKSRQTDLLGGDSYTYLLGIFLEDPAAGVGTMSFYDQYSGRFGALGHTITDSLGRPIRIAGGSIVEANIDSVRQGSKGSPGEKLGFFHGEQDVLGSIDSNSPFGIFGQLTQIPLNSNFPEPLPVA